MATKERNAKKWQAEEEIDALLEFIERERRDRFDAFQDRLAKDADDLRRTRREFEERVERIYADSGSMFHVLKPSVSASLKHQSSDDGRSFISSSELTEFEPEEEPVSLPSSMDKVLSESQTNKEARMVLADLHRARTVMSIQSLFSHIHEVYGIDLSDV